MKKNNRECMVCHRVYTFCPSCAEFRNMPAWMTMFEKENCKKVYELVSNLLANTRTKEQAAEELGQIDLSDIELYNEATQKIIKDILATKVKTEPEIEEGKPVEKPVKIRGQRRKAPIIEESVEQ